jgi:hypothetical protein
MSLHFYDATEPRNVPSGVHAAVYVNGLYAWPQHDIDRMGAVFRITVKSGAEWAAKARCIDIEAGDATPASAMSFLIERHKRFGDATAYCNRSTWPAVKTLVQRAGISVFYWIATLDGTQTVPGAWAVQYYGGMTSPYDLSVLHGVDNFHKP